MTRERMLITPKQAADWLANLNENNRDLKPFYVKRFSISMKEGGWVDTGDPIRFDTAGNLIDGQHRLSAIVDSGQTLELDVCRNVDPNVKNYIDIGCTRKDFDILKLNGLGENYKDRRKTTGASLWVDNYERGVIGHTKNPTYNIMDFIEKHPNFIEISKLVDEKKTRVITPSILLAIGYLGWVNNPDLAKQFINGMQKGFSNTSRPFNIIREKFINDRPGKVNIKGESKKVSGYMLEKSMFYVISKAWEHERKNTQCQMVQWVWNTSKLNLPEFK